MTSGIYRTWVDITADCYLCGWSGDTQICDDLEDMKAIWTCPGCGAEHTEVHGD